MTQIKGDLRNGTDRKCTYGLVVFSGGGGGGGGLHELGAEATSPLSLSFTCIIQWNKTNSLTRLSGPRDGGTAC